MALGPLAPSRALCEEAETHFGPQAQDLLSPMELATVDRTVQPFLVEAILAEQQGDPAKAAAAYRLVLLREPRLERAVTGLGRSLLNMGDPDEAARVLAILPDDSEAVSLRARILENSDPVESVRLYRRLRTLELGSPLPYLREAILLSEIEPVAASEALDTYLDLEDGPPDFETVMMVALGLKEAGEAEIALALLEETRARWPDQRGLEPIFALQDRIGVEQEAARLTIGGAEPLTTSQLLELNEARRIFGQGEPERALGLLRDLTIRAPRAPEVWGTLGDIHFAQGGITESERAFVAAVTLAPEDATAHARLGILLAERYGGRRHKEAELELNAALGLRPMWFEIHRRLGMVRQEMGDFEGAIRSFETWLAHGIQEDPSRVQEIRQRLEDLRRQSPNPMSPVIPPPIERPIPEQSLEHYHIARVYRGRGLLHEAREEIDKALSLAPNYVDGLRFLAALELEQGRSAQAAEIYERCLAASDSQPDVYISLAEIRRSQGDIESANQLLRRAAETGAPEAWYLLAAMAFQARETLEAREFLRSYFAASTGGLAHEPAIALDARINARIRTYELFSALCISLLLTLPALLLLRHRLSRNLRDLLQKEPSSWHEVARLLSAVRHEVLKHNTTLLHTVAVRLDQGDTEAAAYAASRLFGRPGEPGVIERFECYLEELEKLGRKHGLRMDLRHRDPVLAPMHRAFRRLARLERALHHPGRNKALATELRQLSHALNEVGYQALGELLKTVCVLEVEPELFKRVYQRVLSEPNIHGHAPEHLELRGLEVRAPVRIFKADLEDIAANLFRNAIQVLMDELPRDRRRIGLALVEEMDPVTGLEQLMIRFVDNAPRPVTDALLRGRAIERGLGLAVDLLTRHQGLLSVEDEPGWAKAFVVRLPRAEVGDLAEEVSMETEEETNV